MDCIMKINKVLSIILLLSFVSSIEAHGRSKKHRYKHRKHSGTVFRYSYYPKLHNHYYYKYPRHYTYLNVEKRNMVLTDADMIINQIKYLKEMEENNIINEKEFKKLKKRLLNRIGKYVEKKKIHGSEQAINQIKKLYKLEQNNILTKKEFNKQKKKMLKII